MKNSFKPIALDEKSYNVNLLHKALAALGLPLAKGEVAQGKAGDDTRKQVRFLQGRLGVPVDESVLVDKATVLAISEAMEETGLSAANRSFTVSGTARLLWSGLA